MEQQFHRDDFEHYLHQQTGKHSLFASERVWQAIYTELHGHKRWPGLLLVSIAILLFLIIGTVFFSPYKSTQLSQLQFNQSSISATKQAVTAPHPATHADVYTAATIDLVKKHIQQQFNNTNSVNTTGNPILLTRKATSGISNPTIATPFVTNTEPIQPQPVYPYSRAATMVRLLQPAPIYTQTVKITTHKPPYETNFMAQAENAPVPQFIVQKPSPSKWTYRLYFTPSVSDRRWEDDKPASLRNSATLPPFAAPIAENVNQVVSYKQGLGLELGFTTGYQINKKINFFAGVQANIRRYQLEAFYAGTEATTITLLRAGGIDSINIYAYLSSKQGHKQTSLTNQFVQISIPVGIDYTLLQGKKMGLHLAASVQPSYSFTNSTYIISADYKKYTNAVQLVRNWNINSALEAYLTYKVGDFRWTLGPQFRFQHLPSLNSKYPIREYLFDYGVKIGFTKTIR
jgi:hypothetical protein